MFNIDTHLIFEAYYTRTYLIQEAEDYRIIQRGYMAGTTDGDRAAVLLEIPGHGPLAFYKSSSGTGGKKKKDH